MGGGDACLEFKVSGVRAPEQNNKTSNKTMKYMPLQFKTKLVQQPTAMKITEVHH